MPFLISVSEQDKFNHHEVRIDLDNTFHDSDGTVLLRVSVYDEKGNVLERGFVAISSFLGHLQLEIPKH